MSDANRSCSSDKPLHRTIADTWITAVLDSDNRGSDAVKEYDAAVAALFSEDDIAKLAAEGGLIRSDTTDQG